MAAKKLLLPCCGIDIIDKNCLNNLSMCASLKEQEIVCFSYPKPADIFTNTQFYTHQQVPSTGFLLGINVSTFDSFC